MRPRSPGLRDRLPEARPFARKRGFSVPVGAWMGGRGDRLGALVAAQPGVEEACRPEAVKRLFSAPGKHRSKAAWTLLFFALWHRRHILGRPPEGDVFDTLSAPH